MKLITSQGSNFDLQKTPEFCRQSRLKILDPIMKYYLSETSGYFIEESNLDIFQANCRIHYYILYYSLYKVYISSIYTVQIPIFIKFLVILDVMPGIDFKNQSCWNFKTLVVEGGMWIECTGSNLPKAGDEPYYMVEIKDFKKGFSGNSRNCLSGADVQNCTSQLCKTFFVSLLLHANNTEHSIGTQNKWEVFNCEEKRIKFFDGTKIRFRTPFLNACNGCDQINGKIMSDELLKKKQHCAFKADGLEQIQFNLFKSEVDCSGMVILVM